MGTCQLGKKFEPVQEEAGQEEKTNNNNIYCAKLYSVTVKGCRSFSIQINRLCQNLKLNYAWDVFAEGL